MPAKSKAQLRWAYAAEEGKVPGVSPKVGKEIVSKTKSTKNLPERKGKNK